MYHKRPSHMTPALALLCAVCLLPLLLPATAEAKIVVTIYGNGGIQILPPAVCPDSSDHVCATIEFFATDPYDVVVKEAGSSNEYNAVLGTAIQSNSMQGKDLDIESITPIE
jgi:hypothetical protein